MQRRKQHSQEQEQDESRRCPSTLPLHKRIPLFNREARGSEDKSNMIVSTSTLSTQIAVDARAASNRNIPNDCDERLDIAFNLCNVGASLHELRRTDHALDLYDESLQTIMSILKTSSSAPSLFASFSRARREDLALHQRRVAKLNWARTVAQMEKDRPQSSKSSRNRILPVLDLYIGGEVIIPPASDTNEESSDANESSASSTSYAVRQACAPSTFTKPLLIQRQHLSQNSPVTAIGSATLLHNMGLLHHQNSESDNICISSLLRRQQLSRSMQLLQMALATLIEMRNDSSSCKSSSTDQKKNEEDGFTFVLLLSILINIGQVHAKCSRYEEAKDVFHGAIDLANDLMAQDDDDDDDQECAEPEESSPRQAKRRRYSIPSSPPPSSTQPQYNYQSEIQQLAIITFSSISHFYLLRSQHEQALVASRTVLDLRRSFLHEHHIDIATSVYNIGCIYYAMKDWAKARKYFAKFATTVTRTTFAITDAPDFDDGEGGMSSFSTSRYPEDELCMYVVSSISRVILIDCKEWGSDTQQQKRWYGDNMKNYQEKLLEIRETCGWTSKEVLPYLKSIGDLLFEQEDYGMALAYYTERLRVQRAVLPSKPTRSMMSSMGGRALVNHAEVAVTMNCIGQTLYRAGEYNKAAEVYQSALQIRFDTITRQCEEQGKEKNRAGQVWRGDQVTVEDVSDNDEVSSSFSADHPVFPSLLFNMGLLLTETGRHGEALKSYRLARTLSCELVDVVDKQHVPSIAATLHNIGTVLHREYGQLNEASQILSEALGICKTEYGEEHPAYTKCLVSLGRVSCDEENYDHAMECFGDCLRIEQKMWGKNSSGIASTLCNIGQVLDLMGKPEEALQIFHEALRIIRSLSISSSRPPSISISVVLNAIGTIYYDMGDSAQAMMAFTEAMTIAGVDQQVGVMSLVEGGDHRTAVALQQTMASAEALWSEAFPPAAAAA